MELKLSSLLPVSLPFNSTVTLLTYHPEITVRTAYDLKPCKTDSATTTYIRITFTYVDDDLDDPHFGACVVV